MRTTMHIFLLLGCCQLISANVNVATASAPVKDESATNDASADNVKNGAQIDAAYYAEEETNEEINISKKSISDVDGEVEPSEMEPNDLQLSMSSLDSSKKTIDKSKYPKHLYELSPEEIHTKTDAELFALYHDNAKIQDSWVHDNYRSIIDKMDKPDITDVELKVLFKKRDMIERRMEKMEAQRVEKAEKV